MPACKHQAAEVLYVRCCAAGRPKEWEVCPIHCMQNEMPYHEQGWKAIQVGQNIALTACHLSNSPYWPAPLQACKAQTICKQRDCTSCRSAIKASMSQKPVTDWERELAGSMKV